MRVSEAVERGEEEYQLQPREIISQLDGEKKSRRVKSRGTWST